MITNNTQQLKKVEERCGKSMSVNLQQQSSFESSLQPGQLVVARFTNSFQYFQFVGSVVKVNAGSIRVATTQDGSPYPNEKAGRVFTFPRVYEAYGAGLNKKWSVNNGVFPLKE